MSKYLLEDIITLQPLKGKHDQLIQKTARDTELSPNVSTMFMSGYYKMRDKSRHTGTWEGDFDLLQMHYDNGVYRFESWQEIPCEEAVLLLFEMKSSDSPKNHLKAIEQLYKSKSFIKKFTDYQNIDCFYCYNLGSSYLWSREEIGD